MVNQLAYIGKDAITEFQHSLNRLSAKRVLLLRGKKSFSACGAEKLLSEIFTQLGIERTEWSDFQENPKYDEVLQGVEILKKDKYDAIIACGGGSVIDMAKLVRFAYSYIGDLTGKDFIKERELLPLFAIPTTAGTGAEATPFAVCYKESVKYSVAHNDILPDYAIVYPPFTYGNTQYLTACTGFDALAQATEAYWNPNHTDESDEYALKAMKLVHDNLDKIIKKRDWMEESDLLDARDKVAEGAYYAGKAIAITKTTAPHAFSYAFTTYCGYPHGHAVALTFPFFFDLNVARFQGRLQPDIDETLHAQRMHTLCQIWGVEPRLSQNKVKTYIECIELKNKGFNSQNLDFLLSKVNLQRLSNNPTIVDNTILKELKLFLVNSVCL